MTSDPSLVCPVSPEAVYDDSVSITKEDVVIETESLAPTAPPLYPVLPSAESPLTPLVRYYVYITLYLTAREFPFHTGL